MITVSEFNKSRILETTRVSDHRGIPTTLAGDGRFTSPISIAIGVAGRGIVRMLRGDMSLVSATVSGTVDWLRSMEISPEPRER